MDDLSPTAATIIQLIGKFNIAAVIKTLAQMDAEGQNQLANSASNTDGSNLSLPNQFHNYELILMVMEIVAKMSHSCQSYGFGLSVGKLRFSFGRTLDTTLGFLTSLVNNLTWRKIN